jgi:hypothetical protein
MAPSGFRKQSWFDSHGIANFEQFEEGLNISFRYPDAAVGGGIPRHHPGVKPDLIAAQTHEKRHGNLVN